ncbi:hypothetical protein FRC17_009581 [Serendipita sp. 399]|nr:hypothetical protein FRC17_009581 [Serendipita sp. 399]
MSLLDLYIGAVDSIHSTQAFCDKNLAKNDLVKLSTSMRELTQAITRDRLYLGFVTNPAEHEHRLTALLSTPEGHKALRDLTDALKAATDFVNFTRMEKTSEQTKILGIRLGPTKAFGGYLIKDEEVEEADRKMKALTRDVTESTQRLMGIWNGLPSAPAATSDAVKQYEQARNLVVTLFRKHYFNMSKAILPRDAPPLGILNRSLRVSVISNTYNQQPIFQDIETEARNWVNIQTKSIQAEINISKNGTGHLGCMPRRALHEVTEQVLAYIQGFLRTAAGTALDAEASKEWEGSSASICQMQGAVQNSLNELESSKKQKPIAVCGRVKAGKSSTINALIGRELLTAREEGCTVWPTLIRNDRYADTPTLTVESDQFFPYLEFLQKWNLPELREPTTSEAENFFNKYNKLGEPLQIQVKKFSQKDFKLRHKSKGDEEIQETIADISDLLRICYKLSPYDPNILPNILPDKKSSFPILQVKFQGHGAHLEDIELLDLPGIGDSGIGVLGLDATYDHALPQCDAAILVSRATQANIADNSFKTSCEFLRKKAAGKPMVLVGTHSDSHRPKKWAPHNADEFARTLFQDYDPDVAKNRVHYCSPALFFGAMRLLQTLDDMEKDGSSVSLSEEALCADDKIDVLATTRPSNVSVEWDDKDSLRNFALFSKTRSATDKLAWHIRENIVLDLMDEGYATALSPVKDHLLKLWQTQQGVLDAARDRVEALEKIQARHADSKKQINLFCGIWDSNREEFSKTAGEALSKSLDEAEEEAKTAISDTVNVVSGDYKHGDKTVGTNRLTGVQLLIRIQVSFPSQDDALSFLCLMAERLTEALDEVQKRLVEKTRLAAENAWKARIQKLAGYLHVQKQDELNKSLEKLVIHRLDELSSADIADKLGSLVQDKVEGFKSKTSFGYQPWQTRSAAFQTAAKQINDQLKAIETNGDQEPLKLSEDPEHDKHLLQKLTTLRLRLNEQNMSLTTVPSRDGVPEKVPSTAISLSAPDAQALYQEGMNYLGCLVRAPVPGTTVQCPITKRIWPFLYANKPRIEIKQVVATYEKYMLKGWRAIVEYECRKGLDAAITLSSLLGMLTVVEAIEEQDAMISDVEAQSAVPLAEHVEERIILAQTNYVGALAAVDALCTLLEAWKKERKPRVSKP